MTDQHWRQRGACTTASAEEFFPLGYGADHATAAKKICGRCTEAPACLAWAVDNGVSTGVWGGRTAAERRKYGKGPMPYKPPPPPPPVVEVKPRPSRRMTSCPRHGTTGIRLRARHKGTYCQPCNADKVRAWREKKAQAQAVPA